MSQNENEFYATQDIYVAATLITIGYYMETVDYKIDERKKIPVGIFKFKMTPELKEVEKKYLQDLIKVEPKTFINNLRGLKANTANVYKNPSTDDKEKIYSTRDIYLSATLVTLGILMEGVDYQVEGDKNNTVGYFKFKSTPELKELEQKYWQGLTNVNPKVFTENLHSLKLLASKREQVSFKSQN